MAERLDWRDDEQLERALRALGRQLAYPPTPDLASSVRARLAAGRPARRSRLAWWFAAPVARRLAYAFVALIALVGALLIVSPEARRAVANRLGVPGITIEFVVPTPTRPAGAPATPTLPASPTPPGTPTSVGNRLGLGQRVTLEVARASVGFPVQLPSLPELGPPDEIYLGTPPVGGQVSFVWLPRPGLPEVAGTGAGLLITQFQAKIDWGFAKKIVGDKTTVEYVDVNGGEGFWLSGEPHEFFYLSTRVSIPERVRLAGNVLLWEVGGVTYRIEGPRTLEEAMAIARSLR
jgi:hypothetical protein